MLTTRPQIINLHGQPTMMHLPVGAIFLDTHIRDGQLMLWIQADWNLPASALRQVVVTQDHQEVSPDCAYLGTAVGVLQAWHVWEKAWQP